MDVSIVIPTKNAGPLFDKVLDRVFKQETEYTYEVICVDSGSSDNTLEIIKKYPQSPPRCRPGAICSLCGFRDISFLIFLFQLLPF